MWQRKHYKSWPMNSRNFTANHCRTPLYITHLNQDRMWHINTKISARQTSAQGSVSSLFVTSCLPGEIFTRHCASTVKHGIFNAHIRISRFLVRTSFEDHIKIPPSQIRDPKSPVGSLRGNFLVCRTCPLLKPLSLVRVVRVGNPQHPSTQES